MEQKTYLKKLPRQYMQLSKIRLTGVFEFNMLPALTGFSKVTGARRKSPATSSVSAGYFWNSKLKKIIVIKNCDSYG